MNLCIVDKKPVKFQELTLLDSKILVEDKVEIEVENIYACLYFEGLRNITFISSIIGFACAIPMAYYYSYTGVAIVIVFTRCLMALLITHKALKIKRQKG